MSWLQSRTFTICAIAAVILAGCSGGGSGSNPGSAASDVGIAMTPGSPTHPVTLVPTDRISARALLAPGSADAGDQDQGIYVSQFYATSIQAYRGGNRKNAPPSCTLPGTSVNDVAVDGAGNLMDPDGGSSALIVYKGNALCGKVAAKIADPNGQPGDASSPNALTSRIAVGNIVGPNSSAANITMCSVKAGCTTELTDPNMFELAGVAMDARGNCYADVLDSSKVPHLLYFRACKMPGRLATGFTNPGYGGIDIDNQGHLVTISLDLNNYTSAVVVYSGCDPACTQVSATPLKYGVLYGHLNHDRDTKLAVASYAPPEVDIYAYRPNGVRYEYSFNNGLSASAIVVGAAYTKRP